MSGNVDDFSPIPEMLHLQPLLLLQLLLLELIRLSLPFFRPSIHMSIIQESALHLEPQPCGSSLSLIRLSPVVSVLLAVSIDMSPDACDTFYNIGSRQNTINLFCENNANCYNFRSMGVASVRARADSCRLLHNGRHSRFTGRRVITMCTRAFSPLLLPDGPPSLDARVHNSLRSFIMVSATFVRNNLPFLSVGDCLRMRDDLCV